jgi:hypothetical protein
MNIMYWLQNTSHALNNQDIVCIKPLEKSFNVYFLNNFIWSLWPLGGFMGHAYCDMRWVKMFLLFLYNYM